MPEQLVVVAQLRIAFANEDFQVLVPGDRTLLFEIYFWPTLSGKHGPRKPSHIKSEVVEPAQEDVRANGSGFQDAQEMFGSGFQ